MTYFIPIRTENISKIVTSINYIRKLTLCDEPVSKYPRTFFVHAPQRFQCSRWLTFRLWEIESSMELYKAGWLMLIWFYFPRDMFPRVMPRLLNWRIRSIEGWSREFHQTLHRCMNQVFSKWTITAYYATHRSSTFEVPPITYYWTVPLILDHS